MAATAAEKATAALQERLTYDTPFWAGGAYRDDAGAWRMPRAGEFPGVAKILSKQRKLVPIVPRPWQLEFDDKLEAQRAAGLPMRAIILKARKLGFSTWVALKTLQRLTMIEYQQAIIVAQDVKTAGQIFNMAQLCHAHLPTVDELDVGFSIRPEIIGQSFSPNGRKFLQFGEKSKRLREAGRVGDSILEIDTAGAPEAGRGYTPSILHLSEYGRWQGEQAVMKGIGLLNAIPYEPETIVVIESTADGLNHFYRRWIAARDGQEDPDTGETYVPLFVPWWRDPAAAMAFSTVEDRERFEAGIGDEDTYGETAADELMLVESYGCTPEQLRWRRMQIRTQHNGNVDLFNQENPHSDEAAFIGSGRTVFGGILVARAIREAEETPAPVRGTLVEDPELVIERRTRGGSVLVPHGALWVPEQQAGSRAPILEVWEHPIRKDSDDWPADTPAEERVDGAYVVGVDVALGESNTFTEADFHCLQVLDHRTLRQVAVHESRMPLDELALWVLLVATYYNVAWLGVEVQGPGIAPVDTLQKSYRYRRMYRRKRFDRVRQLNEDRPGWSTDSVTKPVMETTLATALREETAGIRDIRTARQLSTYVVDEKGKHGAQDGEHDDRLLGLMIARQIAELLRPPLEKRTRRRREPHDPVTGY